MHGGSSYHDQTLTCGTATAECGGEWRAAGSGRRALGGGRWAAGGGNDDGDGNEQVMAVYSNVRLFSSCGDSSGI